MVLAKSALSKALRASTIIHVGNSENTFFVLVLNDEISYPHMPCGEKTLFGHHNMSGNST
jgi:hypothetical protein